MCFYLFVYIKNKKDYGAYTSYEPYSNVAYAGQNVNRSRYDMTYSGNVPYSMNNYNYSQAEQNSNPITLTWNVNVYAKIEKSLPDKIRNVFDRSDDENYKHILKNGKFIGREI